MCLMQIIERETQYFILKFMEIFPRRETVLRIHGMKSDQELFFCQIYVICDWQVFFFIFGGFLT